MKQAVVDTNVLIAFLGRDGSSVAAALRTYDRLIVPAAVDAEFRAGLDPDTRAGREGAALVRDIPLCTFDRHFSLIPLLRLADMVEG